VTCEMKDASRNPGSGTKVKCERCRNTKMSCSWGEAIPLHLHALKVAIHGGRSVPAEMAEAEAVQEGHRDADQELADADADGPSDTESDFSPEGLARLLRVTVAARAEVDVQIQRAKEWEGYQICNNFQDLGIFGNDHS
jgi:hypothetical protein